MAARHVVWVAFRRREECQPGTGCPEILGVFDSKDEAKLYVARKFQISWDVFPSRTTWRTGGWVYVVTETSYGSCSGE